MLASERVWPLIRFARRAAFLSALLLGAAQFTAAVPARAGGVFDGGGGADGGGRTDDYGADHADVYQVQRGEIVCNSREACGGPAAIPMNRPGWYYMPRGMVAQRGIAPNSNAPYASYHVKKHRHPTRQ
jgi:hypothetical protein